MTDIVTFHQSREEWHYFAYATDVITKKLSIMSSIFEKSVTLCQISIEKYSIIAIAPHLVNYDKQLMTRVQ